jgi:poly(glycerol-phosphate) alpha-glucosyltransferase
MSDAGVSPAAASPSPLAGRRIALVTASASRLGGGVFEAVVAQAEMIRTLGGDAAVFALRDAHSETDRARFGSSDVSLADVRGPRQIGYAPDLERMLLAAGPDCVHLHGIWMYPSASASNWACRTERPYFISPHGMLDQWITNRGRWKKALARAGYERTNWARATALHALTAREAKDIARESGRDDSIVIPNAGPETRTVPRTAMPGPVITYIGRIHPKKNLLALVEAWTRTPRPDGARLVLAGWGDPHDVATLEAAVAQGDGSAQFIGPVYGKAKADLLGSARFVALPSHSEGLPMAMLEAWSAGVPTLMTDECNLAEGFAAGAALNCGYDAAAIAACLEHALAMDEAAWRVMSEAARAVSGANFSASVISARWGQLYSAAICSGTRR